MTEGLEALWITGVLGRENAQLYRFSTDSNSGDRTRLILR